MNFFKKISSLFFDEEKNNKLQCLEVVAPLSGEVKRIEDVPDYLFSNKIVGDGVAIKPSSNKIVAPINGTIIKIFAINHAFVIKADNGIELFIHFGIETVNLKGKGFRRIARENQYIQKGDVVIECDLSFLEEKSKSILTPIIIPNMDKTRKLLKFYGKAKTGETPIIRIWK